MNNCQYCKGKVCDGKRKTATEWNKCPWHKALSDSYISFLPELIRDLIFEYKLWRYRKNN